MLGARIPPQWMEQFQKMAKSKGCSTAEIAREAFFHYLKAKTDISDISDLENLRYQFISIAEETSDITDISNPEDSNNQFASIKEQESDITDITLLSQRLVQLEKRVQVLEEQATTQEEPIEVKSLEVRATINNGWLTTGEAYQQAQLQGLNHSVGTFRRWLKTALTSETLPTQLQALGLEADWQKRKSSNPKDNSLRWLRFKN